MRSTSQPSDRSSPQPDRASSDTAPRVFISYSHDSEMHRQRVLDLANRLREGGLDVRLDRYVESPPEGWPQWIRRQVSECDFVLLVCTPAYGRHFERAEPGQKGNGATWQAMLAEQLLYEYGARNQALIPLLFAGGRPQDVPLPFRAFTGYWLPADFEALYRRLTNQPEHAAPPIGRIRAPSGQPRSRSLGALLLGTLGGLLVVVSPLCGQEEKTWDEPIPETTGVIEWETTSSSDGDEGRASTDTTVGEVDAGGGGVLARRRPKPKRWIVTGVSGNIDDMGREVTFSTGPPPRSGLLELDRRVPGSQIRCAFDDSSRVSRTCTLMYARGKRVDAGDSFHEVQR
jgi:SEFIR domain